MKRNFKEKRRNYFIKKEFQRNFIVKFCILVIIGAVISGSIIYMMSRSTVTTTFENSRLTIKSTADYILPAVLLSSVIVIFLIGVASIGVTLFTSHRIAGPLYRMEKDVEEVASGNLKKRFSLRKTDELKALAESLDRMTHTFGASIDAIKKNVAELESREGSDEFREELRKLKATLSKFIT